MRKMRAQPIYPHKDGSARLCRSGNAALQKLFFRQLAQIVCHLSWQEFLYGTLKWLNFKWKRTEYKTCNLKIELLKNWSSGHFSPRGHFSPCDTYVFLLIYWLINQTTRNSVTLWLLERSCCQVGIFSHWNWRERQNLCFSGCFGAAWHRKMDLYQNWTICTAVSLLVLCLKSLPHP